MTIIETVLVFLGIPVALYVVVALAVYSTANRHAPRYRPGRPYAFEPVWFVAARPPHPLDDPTRPALPPVAVPAAISSAPTVEPTTTTGGARGSW